MNRSQIFTIIGVATLIIACFIPWMRIEEASITISGVDTTGTRYGKPGYGHFLFSIFILVFTFIPRLWAKRAMLLFAAFNLAWAMKNFGVIPKCEGGICPEKLLGLYLVLISSILLLLTALFPKEPVLKNKI